MKTKNLCGILMLFSFLVSCTEQQCIIHGITTGVKDGDYMYITEYLDNTYFDSAVVMNGKFTFKLPKASEEDFLPKVIVPAVGNEPSVAMVFTQDSEVKYIRDSNKDIFVSSRMSLPTPSVTWKSLRLNVKCHIRNLNVTLNCDN